MQVSWNPWHGCRKVSTGCKHCYVYRMDKRFGRDPSECKPTSAMELPLWKDRHGMWKFKSGTSFMLCFTSDFLLEDADEYRDRAWRCIRQRSDCTFMFVTKRIERFMDCVPSDWGDGWDNVAVYATCENQMVADKRMPALKQARIKHKGLCLEPLLGYVDCSMMLDDPSLDRVICGGESGSGARECNYEWVKHIADDCSKHGVPFCFKQTGARFVDSEGHLNKVARKDQYSRANDLAISDFSVFDI